MRGRSRYEAEGQDCDDTCGQARRPTSTITVGVETVHWPRNASALVYFSFRRHFFLGAAELTLSGVTEDLCGLLGAVNRQPRVRVRAPRGERSGRCWSSPRS